MFGGAGAQLSQQRRGGERRGEDHSSVLTLPGATQAVSTYWTIHYHNNYNTASLQSAGMKR